MPSIATMSTSNEQPITKSEYMTLDTVDIEDQGANDDNGVVTVSFNRRASSISSNDEASSGESDKEEANSEELEVLQATTFYLKVKLMLGRGIPMVSSFFISYLSAMIIMLFASHYGFKEGNSDVLAGVTLANLFGNVSLFSILVGLSTAVETLGSQNFGAKNYEEVGVVLQRCVCILTTVSIPLLFLWVFAGRFFAYCGIESNVVSVISNLLYIRAVAFPAEILNVSYEKYLCSMGVTTPTLLQTITQNIVLLILLPLFVLTMGLSYPFISVAQVISIYASLGVHIYSSLGHDAVQKTLQRPNKRALTEWGKFIALGVPGAAMICSEWWAYEFLAFMASRLGTASVAAQSLMLQVLALAYMVPLGFSIATASLVGNALGAKQRQLAIDIARISYLIILVADFIIAFSVYFAGGPFIHFLSNDQQVIDIFESMLGFLSLVPFIDGNQCMSSGIMRGTGKQFVGAIINFAAFYFIGLPCAWYFCFKLNFGVGGLLKGLYVGAVTQTIILSIMVLRYDNYIFSAIPPEHTHAASIELVDASAPTSPESTKSLRSNDELGIVSEIDVESGVELATRESLGSSSTHGESDTSRLIQ
jgi:MATE family multidrug resistance protein